MNQEAFRRLVVETSSRPTTSSTQISRPSGKHVSKQSKPNSEKVTQFKPRAVAKPITRVEQDEVAQPAVKGLDLTLLAQERARLALGLESRPGEDINDEDLEAALISHKKLTAEEQTASQPSKQPKRNRDDIIKALKQSRTAETAALPASKFKRIGDKNAGAEVKDEKKKKKKKKRAEGQIEANDEPKSKKRKLDNEAPLRDTPEEEQKLSAPTLPSEANKRDPAAVTQRSQPVDEEDDDDIFADVGEYKGIPSEDEDEDDEDGPRSKPDKRSQSPPAPTGPPTRNWFNSPPPTKPRTPTPPPAVAQVKPPQDEEDLLLPDGKLKALAFSGGPSVREILAMDEAAERDEKRKARKEKNKGKKPEGEKRVEQEYKKLSKYMAGKASGSKP